MKQKLLALLLAAVLSLSLLPTSALADAVERPVITNYEELVEAENSTETYYFIPAADFGWPEEPTEVSITADLRMDDAWVIPEQATVNLSGKLQPAYGSNSALTVNGTLNLIDKMLLKVHRITIAGTLMASGTSVGIYADEGEVLNGATFNLVPVTDTTRTKLGFYGGPKYNAEMPTHWVFHEGITFLGADPSKYSIGDLSFRDGLFETKGTVRSQYALYSYGAAIKGDWIFSQINVHGNGLTVEGSVSCRSLNASAGLTIPEGSTFAVELWEEAPGYSSSLNASRGAEILVNGTLRMGRQLNVKLNGNGPIVGTGVVDARANNSWGNQQPVFLADGTWIKVDDIDWDRAAYADLIAESLTIQKNWIPRPAFTVNPENVSVNAGEEAVFTVTANYATSYQWMYKINADSTEKLECTDAMGTGAQTDTFRLIAKPEYDGYVFYCRASNEGSSRNSASATLTVLSNELGITSQPQNFVGAAGDAADFSVTATGLGLSYQWQFSDNNGKTWKNSSATTPDYSTKLTTARDGRLVRCIVTDENGETMTSDAASMRILKLAITAQPQDFVGKVNSTAVFTVEAEGLDLSYQWQFSDNNGAKWSKSSVITNTYSAKLTAAKDGRLVRCIVTDKNGNSIISDAARMTIEKSALRIVTQPEDYEGPVNSTASFTVKATGEGLTYQWQISDNDGAKWSKSSVTEPVYTTKLSAARDGRLVRCIVTDESGNQVTSEPAAMRIGGFRITTQPENYVGKVNSTASFTVVAEGEGLTYQWQISDNDGAKWSKSSVTEPVYTTKLSATRDGRLVRCIVTDANGNTLISDNARMTIG